jgi:hypothetical protein
MRALEKLSLILWRERELLTLLAFRLEMERLVLLHGRSWWLDETTRDIDGVLGELRATEVLRAVAADEVAAELGMDPNPSLATLAEVAPEPWATILADHRSAILALTAEIAEASEAARELLRNGHRSIRETMLAVAGGTDGAEVYAADGSAVVGAGGRRLVDRSL